MENHAGHEYVLVCVYFSVHVYVPADVYMRLCTLGLPHSTATNGT